MTTTLRDMKEGENGRVMKYARGSSLYKQRLLSMGLTPGTGFTVQRIAPLGDPVEIKVRGSRLSLRKEEAAVLSVEIMQEGEAYE